MVDVDDQSDLFIVQHTLDRFAIVVRCLGLVKVLASCHFANGKKALTSSSRNSTNCRVLSATRSSLKTGRFPWDSCWSAMVRVRGMKEEMDG